MIGYNCISITRADAEHDFIKIQIQKIKHIAQKIENIAIISNSVIEEELDDVDRKYDIVNI